MYISILDYLENSNGKFSNKEAIIDGNNRITYHDLFVDARRIGSGINKKIDAQKRPIVVLIKKSYKSIITFLGIVYSGNIYVPLDEDSPIERLKRIMITLNPEAIIYDDETHNKISQELNEYTSLKYSDLITHEINETKLAEIRKKIIDINPLYIMYTSGSTGNPKGVVINHKSVIDFVEESSEAMNFSDSEVFLNQAPFYFDASVPDIYCMLRNSATLHIVSKIMFSFPVNLMRYISENSINAIFWVPSALVSVANLRVLDKYDISCIKKVMFCGEVMPVKQLNIWKNTIPNAVFVNYYGPAETTYACTYYIVNRDFSDEDSLPIGFPCKNTEVIILGESDKIVNEIDCVGELCVRGTCLALGYYNDFAKTKEAFVQNLAHSAYTDIYYKTGDLVKYNKYGELEYVCRKDYQIKHMGYRIELGEIEYAGNALEGIKKCCCQYNFLKKEIVLFYEADSEIFDIAGQMKKLLPKYMVPTRYILLENMPMNANGKINRALLKKEANQL